MNTRAQAELLFRELWLINDRKLKIGIHHGSLDGFMRKKVETQMSMGKLDCVVATSSLDLGVDWASIDQIIQIGAPKGVSRLIQRIGRSNHRLDTPSKGYLIPTNRFEFLECIAVIEDIKNNKLDSTEVSKGSLDVLAQHILGMACSGGFYPDFLYRTVITSTPFEDLTFDKFTRVLNFVKNGGYSLEVYETHKKLRVEDDGKVTVNSSSQVRQFKMNIGTIVEAPMLQVVLKRRTLGQIEENFILNLTKDDTFVFAGKTLAFDNMAGTKVFVRESKKKEAKLAVYAGGKQPLSTQLAYSVRSLIGDKNKWSILPEQIKTWLSFQENNSKLPNIDNMLVEVFPHKKRYYMVVHSFLGWNANQTLGFLLLRRMKRSGFRPIGFTMNDYGLALWSFKCPNSVEKLLEPDIVFQEFEEWLEDTPLRKRLFRDVALISGLVSRKTPGREKTGRQVLFSTDLIYDVLMKFEPDHILLEAVRQDAMSGLIDGQRLKNTLYDLQSKIEVKYLEKVSPMAVPLLLEANRELLGIKLTFDDLIAEIKDLDVVMENEKM